ncbi:outer membrane beta-barrel protein [Dyadobacter sp. NIV53]|uniref:outer membrane beta-barrel protein n=1 Tax=Dyadobacter sp. NIV53 TaxID=2861765 RepID=UPI001C88B0CE|nr:outer membrane beta-barrel protein [Dyadobacter sp. NIV53]
MKHYITSALIIFGVLIFSPDTRSQGKGNSAKRYTPPFGVLSLTGGIGLTYYYGDLNNKINLKHLGMGPSVSLGALYRVTEHFSARGEFRFYQTSGEQRYSRYPDNNLSFRTRNPDINLGIQADLFSYNSHARINPYLFLGAGVTYLNPKAKLDGKWYSLPPLTTEGVKYSRLPLVITGAIGVSVQAFERLSLGIEMNNNFVRSDYFDDVSGVFPNPDQLPSDLARRLSDRSSEIGLDPKQPGWHRGVGTRNDIFSFVQLRATYLIGNRMQASERKRMRCPKL